jgi:predicted RNase H-like HicB family nuclease
LVIFERPGKNSGAYVPALDGCVATGKTLRQHGEPVPPPSAIEMEFVDAA